MNTAAKAGISAGIYQNRKERPSLARRQNLCAIVARTGHQELEEHEKLAAANWPFGFVNDWGARRRWSGTFSMRRLWRMQAGRDIPAQANRSETGCQAAHPEFIACTAFREANLQACKAIAQASAKGDGA